MSITSETVSGKRFPTVRRDGYDTGEVDQCLVDLESSLNESEQRLAVLEEANGLLHDQLLRAQDELRLADEERHRLRDEQAAAEAIGTEDEVRASSKAAARLLEMAARDAEELVETARVQAGELLTEAREEAEKLVTMAQDEAARKRARAERRSVEAEARLADLMAFEESYREALGNMLTAQVEALEGPTLAEAWATDAD